MLARDIARGGVRGDLKKVSQTFSLVKAKSELAQEFGIDIAGDNFGSGDRPRRVPDNSPDVKATLLSSRQ